jgi:hypothetical protein
MNRTRILITLVAAAVFGVGCASGGSTASTAAAANAKRGPTGASRYLVTDDELANLGDRSAYEALQQLRPSFLHSRDTQTSSNPVLAPVDVFVDGGRTEGLDALKNIRASTVKEMRFYEPQDANTKFGTGHNGGVIAVRLK